MMISNLIMELQLERTINNNLTAKLDKEKKYNKDTLHIINNILNTVIEKNNNNLSSNLKTQIDIIIDLKSILENNNDIKLNQEREPQTTKCSICLENDLSICCIPCGHTYCNKCIINYNNCFFCRQTIITTQKIYL